MSKAKQLERNVQLSGKLAEYIAANPSVIKTMPKGASFVVFSHKDKELNKENNKLIKSLKSEGKKVVKAVEKDDKKNPWGFCISI